MFLSVLKHFARFLHISVLSGRSGAALGRSWGCLGSSRGVLGRSRGRLGRSWGSLRTLLGRSWGHVGPIVQKMCPKSEGTHFFGGRFGRQNGNKNQ